MAIQGVRGEERKDEGKEGRGQKSWVMEAFVKIPEPVVLLKKCAKRYEVASSQGTDFCSLVDGEKKRDYTSLVQKGARGKGPRPG